MDLHIYVANGSAIGTYGIDGAVFVKLGEAEALPEDGDEEGGDEATRGTEEEGEGDEVGDETGEGEEETAEDVKGVVESLAAGHVMAEELGVDIVDGTGAGEPGDGEADEEGEYGPGEDELPAEVVDEETKEAEVDQRKNEHEDDEESAHGRGLT